MRRRDFLIAAGAAAALPRVALSQQATSRPRIAVVSLPLVPRWVQAIHEGLADYGYVHGSSATVEFITAPTWNEIARTAARAVAGQPDIIVTHGTSVAQAVADATSTVPIVFAGLNDPVGIGLISNRGRPGGNITGSTVLTPDLIGRQLIFAKQVVPDMRRLAILGIASDAPSGVFADQVGDAATQLDLEPVVFHFQAGQDFAAQFPGILAIKADAVYAPSSGYFANNAARLAELQANSALPIIGTSVIEGRAPPFAGVIAYGAAVAPAIRQSASFIDAILKGAKAGDLAVKVPTVFDLAVDLKAAKAIGVTIPPSMVAEATLVIQ